MTRPKSPTVERYTIRRSDVVHDSVPIPPIGLVYLICFDEPYHHARHYIGYCSDGNLAARCHRHRTGRGAKLLRAVVAHGIGFKVVRTWLGDRALERQLKNQKNAPRLCPRCQKRRLS